MTFLVGQQGTGWTLVDGTILSSGTNATYYFAGYTAAATGTATSVNVYVHSAAASGNATVYLYSGTVGTSTTLVAQSSAFSVTTNGLINAAISASITSGQLYTLVVQGSANSFKGAANSGSNNFKDNQNTAAHITYGSPPASLPASDSTNGPEFIIWLDGSTSGGAMQNVNGSQMMMGMGS